MRSGNQLAVLAPDASAIRNETLDSRVQYHWATGRGYRLDISRVSDTRFAISYEADDEEEGRATFVRFVDVVPTP